MVDTLLQEVTFVLAHGEASWCHHRGGRRGTRYVQPNSAPTIPYPVAFDDEMAGWISTKLWKRDMMSTSRNRIFALRRAAKFSPFCCQHDRSRKHANCITRVNLVTFKVFYAGAVSKSKLKTSVSQMPPWRLTGAACVNRDRHSNGYTRVVPRFGISRSHSFVANTG